MEKEFIPYEQALALKELGFDEPCFGYYYALDNKKICLEMYIDVQHQDTYFVQAPLYQQAFRWFREKYKLHSRVFFDKLKEFEDNDINEERYDFDIVEQWTVGKDYFEYSYGFKHIHSSRGVYSTHEEAELECLKKLIEIVKNK